MEEVLSRLSNRNELERIVYRSRAHVDTGSLLVISEILGISQRNNTRDGLTGALAVNEGWFLQVIEGSSSALDKLMTRLQLDPRHDDIEILSRRPVVGRLFGGWTMVATRITPELGFKINRLVDECRTCPEGAVDALIKIVSKH